MEILEIEDKQKMRREEAAELLRKLADSLARHNEVAFNRGGKALHVKVADEVKVEVELEVKRKKSSIEIEISWK